ncbi:tRNA pseudouridine synthase A [Streptosporangium sp. NPDC023615]|uniref:tRNA pseudouridine synthase A n=1 Tax=Streptosporangium sp. NPDC023615 TaxID=3154794 RepID=UPI0034455F19
MAHVDLEVDALAALDGRDRRKGPAKGNPGSAAGEPTATGESADPADPTGPTEAAGSPAAGGSAAAGDAEEPAVVRESAEAARSGRPAPLAEASAPQEQADPAAVARLDERLSALRRRLGGVLPPDVRVHRVTVAPEGFDARFSALSRRYAYRVSDAPGGPDPLRRREVLWYGRPLDVGRLNEAAAALLGEHDFAAFCKRREGATTIRELQRLDWVRHDDLIVATVVADAFCHSMVRALVGSLLPVGEGRLATGWPAGVLARAVRDSGVHVAPAHGLCLEQVSYPDASELARRAAETRRVRTLSS